MGLCHRIVTNAEGDDAVLGEGTFGRVLQGIKGDVQPVVRPMHSCKNAQADGFTRNCCCRFLSPHVTTRSYPWRLSPPQQTPDGVIKHVIVIPDRPTLDMLCAAQAIKTMVRTGDSSTEEAFIREIAMLKCASEFVLLSTIHCCSAAMIMRSALVIGTHVYIHMG